MGGQPLGTLYLTLVSPYPAKTRKMLLNWNNFSRGSPRCLRARVPACEERLRKVGLLTQEMRRLSGDQTAIFQYLQEVMKQMDPGKNKGEN